MKTKSFESPYWTTLKLPLVVVTNRCTAGPRFSPFLSYNFFTTKTKTVRDSDAGIRRTGSPYRRCVGLMRTRCGSVCIRFASGLHQVCSQLLKKVVFNHTLAISNLFETRNLAQINWPPREVVKTATCQNRLRGARPPAAWPSPSASLCACVRHWLGFEHSTAPLQSRDR